MSFGFGVGDFLAVIELSIHIGKKFANAPGELKVLENELQSLSITLKDADERLKTSSKDQTERAVAILQGCTELLKELETFVEKHTEIQSPQATKGRYGTSVSVKMIWKRIKWDPEQVGDFQRRIISTMMKFNAIGQEKIQLGVDSLVDYTDHQQRSEIASWISSTDYSTKQRDILHNRVDPDSSRWLLGSYKFQQWVRKEGQTIFCPGMPGAGKTMTTAIVVEYLESQKVTGALTSYVYCMYQNKEQSHIQILASILRSLVYQLPTVPTSVQKQFDTYGNMGKPMTAAQVISAIRDISKPVRRVNIIIDALDELHRDTRDDLVWDLLRLQGETGLSLWFTSRYQPEIEAKFGQAIKLEIRAADEDVRKYLRASLHRLPRCVSSKQQLQESIIEGIANVVDGMFLLAELHLNSLKDKTSAKEIRETILSLPSGSNAYDDTYSEAMKRINFQPMEYVKLAQTTIKILITARRLLTKQELCYATAVDIHAEDVDNDEDVRKIEDILVTCAGLVRTDDESNTVRLVHKSALDYFQTHQPTMFPDAQYVMGSICGIYLKKKNPKTGNAPFYDYAEKNWWYHLSKATEKEDTECSRDTGDVALSKLSSELRLRLGLESFDNDPVLYITMQDACKSGNQSLLEGLLDITRLSLAEDDELIFLAIEEGHVFIVKTLLTRGAKSTARDKDGQPAIFRAIKLDNVDIVRTILEFEPNLLNSKCGNRGETPLQWAVAQGSSGCTKFLNLQVSRR